MSAETPTDSKQYFGPLTLHEAQSEPTILKDDEVQDCFCVLCEEKFTLPAFEKQMLTHFFMKHKLVIAEVNQIADLKYYVDYWRLKFNDHDLPYYCTTMLLDQKPDGTLSKNEEYFLLSDALPEDKELRSSIHISRIKQILKRHSFEREDKNYRKECLFCRHKSEDTRSAYLNHLYEKHNFHIAKPDNLVFIDNLISLIEKKLQLLQCIFCEGVFKDRNILKEHMRKKAHKRINPDNKEYDKFFVCNYLNYGEEEKNSFKCDSKRYYLNKRTYDNASDTDSDPEWSGWTEDEGPLITCLLCKHTDSEFQKILLHMEKDHNFSFVNATNSLDFYHKIKIVNYIRRQIHLRQCLTCLAKFDDVKNLTKHFKDKEHLTLKREQWDQPEYYFPTYEDDLFLCFIQDDVDSWWSSDEQVMSENVDTSAQSERISQRVALSVLSD